MSCESSSTWEALTRQFYAWERRGRGWELFPYAIALEPPFRPFLGHYVKRVSGNDDGRRPSVFEAFASALRIGGRPTPELESEVYEPAEPEAESFAYRGPLIEVEVIVPTDLKVTRERAAQLLTQLTQSHDPVSFELIGLPEAVSMQFVCAGPDCPSVCAQVQAYFPEAALSERSDFLASQWREAGDAVAIADFGLAREFMLPLRTPKEFEVDPLIPLVAALGEIRPNEIGLVQVVFRSTLHPWGDSIMRAVTDGAGESFFADAPDLISLARAKIAQQPLLAAVVRVASCARGEARAWEIARSLAAALSQFADPSGNELMPLTNEGYPDDIHAADILRRTSHRSGILLNTQELVSIVHLPSVSVRSPKFRNASQKNAFSAIPDELRSRHVYIAGATQHGKSTLIERLALTDIENGHGVCVLDPKGDLIKSILDKIPRHRADDTILLEAANPVPIDFMEWETEQERQTLAADIFQTFLQFSTMTAGDQWLSVLRAVIYTLLDAKGCSFLDINTILINDRKRDEILSRVTNPDILDYWKLEYPLMKKDAAQPIITRMKQFTFTPPLKTLLGTPQAKLDIFECMETRKILLVDLTGAGKANGNLIGQLLVSKIQQSAFRRDRQPRERRVPFHLYADEFQNFQTSAFDIILSEAGGYKLCLTLANQGLYQLEPKIKDAIFSNVTGAWIVFHIDEKDVAEFKLKALPLDSRQLASLPPHAAFIKIGTDSPAIIHTPPPVQTRHASCAEYIRQRTFEIYGSPLEPVAGRKTHGEAISVRASTVPPVVRQQHNGHSAKPHHPSTRRPAQNNADSEFFE
jgi:hypothetical protein